MIKDIFRGAWYFYAKYKDQNLCDLPIWDQIVDDANKLGELGSNDQITYQFGIDMAVAVVDLLEKIRKKQEQDSDHS